MFFMVAAVAVGPSLSAQSFCRAAVNSRPLSEFRNTHESAYLKAPEVRGFLWEASLARSVHLDSIAKGLVQNAGDYVLADGYINTDGIADSLRRTVAHDTAVAAAIALKLAEVWDAAHVGATEGMAFAAASIYHDWHLPPQAALRYLADPRSPPGGRAKAVRALETSWNSPQFREAATAALCSLAVRVAGLAQFQTDTSQSILQPDEYTLLSSIMWALGKVQDDGGPAARDVVSRLPRGNLVTLWTKEWLDIK
jgi:hypothetical protein